MQYRLECHDAAWDADLSGCSDAERQRIHDRMASWVPDGPPDDPLKKYSSFVEFEVFVHELPGFVISYQILEEDDDHGVIEVKRIRRAWPDWM